VVLVLREHGLDSAPKRLKKTTPLIEPLPVHPIDVGCRIRTRERLGGLLKCYYRLPDGISLLFSSNRGGICNLQIGR
jgi:hypothetical protein